VGGCARFARMALFDPKCILSGGSVLRNVTFVLYFKSSRTPKNRRAVCHNPIVSTEAGRVYSMEIATCHK
jgi:hypothetical protein